MLLTRVNRQWTPEHILGLTNDLWKSDFWDTELAYSSQLRKTNEDEHDCGAAFDLMRFWCHNQSHLERFEMAMVRGRHEKYQLRTFRYITQVHLSLINQVTIIMEEIDDTTLIANIMSRFNKFCSNGGRLHSAIKNLNNDEMTELVSDLLIQLMMHLQIISSDSYA